MGLIPAIIAEVVNNLGVHQLVFRRELRLRYTIANESSVVATSNSGAIDGRLTPQDSYNWYGIEIEVGNLLQKVTVQVDTGSSDLWATSKEGVAGTFDPSLSSTFQHISDGFHLQYEDKSTATASGLKMMCLLVDIQLKVLPWDFWYFV